MLGRRQRRALRRLVGGEVPEPVLAWLEGANQGVPRTTGVRRGVLTRRGVAAADMAACGAAPQVKPPAVTRQALDAAGAARRDRGIDSIVSHGLTLWSLRSHSPAI